MVNAIYKEFTVNGKTEGYWVEKTGEKEYAYNSEEKIKSEKSRT